MCAGEYADHNPDADPYCDSNAYEYQHPNSNSLTDPNQQPDAGARQQSMGQLHRDYGGESRYLCPQQCG
jgi:hypothetical protein